MNYVETTDAAPLLEQMAKHADAGVPVLAIEFDPATYQGETTCSLDFCEAAVAAAEEDGEDVVFICTCPECKAETADPFLQLPNKL